MSVYNCIFLDFYNWACASFLYKVFYKTTVFNTMVRFDAILEVSVYFLVMTFGSLPNPVEFYILAEILIIDRWFLFESTRNALFQRNVMFTYHFLHVISEPVSIDMGCGENTLYKDLKTLKSRIHNSLLYTLYKFRPCQLL